MNNNFRLVLNDDLFPVQAFFNAIPDNSYLNTLESFSRGVGASFDDCHCEFQGDLDPEDEVFEGVQFALYDQEVVISNKEFINYVEKASVAFSNNSPEQHKAIEKLITDIKTFLK